MWGTQNLLDEVMNDYRVGWGKKRLKSAWDLRKSHARHLKYLIYPNARLSGRQSNYTHGRQVPYLLEILVIVDVLSLRRILQPVASNILPHSIDDIRPLCRMNPQEACKLASKLVLDWLCVAQQIHLESHGACQTYLVVEKKQYGAFYSAFSRTNNL